MKKREPWWGYVKSIIREYPALKNKRDTPWLPKVSSKAGGTAIISGMISSPVERCVIHDLPPKQQRRLDAVEAAIQETKIRHPDNWQQRLKVVDLIYWKQSKTVVGAAMEIPCHQNTAGMWQAEFIRLVADELELP